MRREYDFSKGKRGALIPQKGKTRISIFIDNAVLAQFRARALKAGTGYQTMMNDALRAYFSEPVAGVKFELGSGNVYADLRVKDADAMLVKAELVMAISRIIRERGLTQSFHGVSERRLIDCLTRLGRDGLKRK
jgi:hypothetical protein